MCVRVAGRLRRTKRERGGKKRRIEPNRSRINRGRASVASAEPISRTLRGLGHRSLEPAAAACFFFFFFLQTGGSFPRLCKFPLTALCHLHRLRRADSRSRNSDSGRGGAAKPPGEAALPGRGFAHTHTASSQIWDGDEEAVARKCDLISLCKHPHFLPPQTPALLSQTPAPHPAGTHAGSSGPQSSFQQNMLLLSLSKHYCKGGGVGRNREAAILELLLHRQWLVQCKIQLCGGSCGQLRGQNSIKVCQRSK